MISRRITAIAGTAVLGAATTLAVTLAPPAGATGAALSTPTGLRVVAATSTSLTVRVHATPHARSYHLYVSTLKSDLYANNITHASSHQRSASATQPEVRVSGLKYTTAPVYYRVAVSSGGQLTLSPSFLTTYLRPKTPTALRSVTSPSGTYLTWRSPSVSGYAIEQATNQSFTQGVRTYRTRGPMTTFTPFGLADGTTYYFRVRGVNTSRMSKPSPTLSTTVDTRESEVRVLAYNSLDASFDGERHPGGVSAPFSKRRPGQLALLKRSNAAVIGIEEGNSCIVKRPHKPCYMQVQSLEAGLKAKYKLDNTDASSAGVDRYNGYYILYNPKVVTPVGGGGHWLIGPEGNLDRFASHQIFRINATGAKFVFIDTHLLATAGSNGDRIRGSETKSLIKQARAYSTRVGIKALIYAGDFNSYRNEWHVNDLTGKAMRAAGIPDGIDVAQTRKDAKYDSVNALYRVAKKGHGSFDHIYAAPGVGVRTWGELLHLHDGRFVGTIPSDHNPVYANVEIPY
jgi:hypothetical protein